MPGSRLQRHPDESAAQELGVRLITVYRPGCSLSDFHAGRTLLDWPDDATNAAPNRVSFPRQDQALLCSAGRRG